ncbi:MAG: DUF3500 domain-containing protein [Chloroflexi bacterium]|nr:DUF3500 domain-containing protein [Chloroflexota bacterium]
MSRPESLRELAARMGECTVKFLASLNDEQRAKAQFDFANHSERTRWFYTPNPRNGLTVREMTRAQIRLAHQLIALGLSRSGYATMTSIMGLEPLLDLLEDWTTPDWNRDPLRYYLSIFGEPSDSAAWGWRFEGHHVSLHYTIVKGQLIAPTPTFFGANPADTPLSANAFLRPLAPTEDLARELVHALSEEQRAIAVLSPIAPPDLMSANRPMLVDGAVTIPPSVIQGYATAADAIERATLAQFQNGYTREHEARLAFTFAPNGLRASDMSASQRELLDAVVHEYIQRMPDELAEAELAQLHKRGIDDLHFIWAGGLERRQGHYYRLQDARVLIEYDNTQDGANHIHSVWRDATNDFGADLLAQHYAHAHR